MPSSTFAASSASSTTTAVRHNGSNGPSVGSSMASTLSNGPQRFPYLFRNVKDFPRRLFHPPNPSVPRVGTVRSLKLTPCYRVSLEDVINGRHLPPLGRKEFEDFLYFKELSVENLYFHIWLLNYQIEWTQWASANSVNVEVNSLNTKEGFTTNPPKANPKLAMSYARAKETFFTSGSPWELNLPQRTLQQLLHPQTPHPGPKSHPHPSALSAVRFEIDAYLNDSLTRFIVQNGGNAGRHRGLFAVTLGTIVIGVGLVPIILNSLARDHTWNQKLLRLSSLPALWFGFATLIAGFHGVCVLIFLFGDARQLYPYELRRPNISSPIICYPSLTLNPNLAANAADRRNRMSNHSTTNATKIEPANRHPMLAALALDNVGVSGGRRASIVPVTISPQKQRYDRTEFVQLPSPGHQRTETATASEATFAPSDGHTNHKHRNSVSKADYESVGNLNFGLYEEGDDYSAKMSDYGRDIVVMPSDDLEAQSATEMFPRGVANRYTPTTSTYATPLHPDMPIAFDFDALPVPSTMRVPEWKASNPTSPISDTGRSVSPTSSPGSAPQPSLPYAMPNQYGSSTSTNAKTAGSQNSGSGSALRRKLQAAKGWEWNKERTVFSPLTIVLDPIITRTQWEIVMRSCVAALIISLVIGLASLGLP